MALPLVLVPVRVIFAETRRRFCCWFPKSNSPNDPFWNGGDITLVIPAF